MDEYTPNVDFKLLIKEAESWNDFFWIEASGDFEIFCESNGGVRIPAKYASMFLNDDMLKEIEFIGNDVYHYKRTVGRYTIDEATIKKCIFAFPNKSTIETYIREINTSIENLDIQSIGDSAFETETYNNSPIQIQSDMKILAYFARIFESRKSFELTEYEMQVLCSSIRNVDSYLKPHWNEMSERDNRDLYRLLMVTMSYINTSIIIKPYEFGEIIEPEIEMFDSSELFPTAF